MLVTVSKVSTYVLACIELLLAGVLHFETLRPLTIILDVEGAMEEVLVGKICENIARICQKVWNLAHKGIFGHWFQKLPDPSNATNGSATILKSKMVARMEFWKWISWILEDMKHWSLALWDTFWCRFHKLFHSYNLNAEKDGSHYNFEIILSNVLNDLRHCKLM